MKKARLVKSKNTNKKEVVEESYSIKKLLIIILIVLILFIAFYFITYLVVKPSSNSQSNTTTSEDTADKIAFSQLLDRAEDEYYVIAVNRDIYKNGTNHIATYNRYINNYVSGENSLKFYRIDLSDALNKNYLGDDLNITDDLSSLKINDEVLFKISNSKIDKYYVGSDSIISALKELK